MIRVKNCFCGVSLYVGVRILLFINLISTSMIIGSFLRLFLQKPDIEIKNCEFIALFFVLSIKSLILVFALVGVDMQKPRFVLPYLVCDVVTLFWVVILLLAVVFGSDTEYAKFVRSVFFTILLQYISYVTFSTIAYSGCNNANDDSFYLVGAIFNLPIWIYFTIVVYSYYKTLQEEGDHIPTGNIVVNSTPPILEKVFNNMAVAQFVPTFRWKLYDQRSTIYYSAQTTDHPQPILLIERRKHNDYSVLGSEFRSESSMRNVARCKVNGRKEQGSYV